MSKNVPPSSPTTSINLLDEQKKRQEGTAHNIWMDRDFFGTILVNHIEESTKLEVKVRQGKITPAEAQALREQFADLLALVLMGRHPHLTLQSDFLGERLIAYIREHYPDTVEPIEEFHPEAFPTTNEGSAQMVYIARRFVVHAFLAANAMIALEERFDRQKAYEIIQGVVNDWLNRLVPPKQN